MKRLFLASACTALMAAAGVAHAAAPPSYGIALGWPGAPGQVTVQQIASPTLQALSLSPLTATAGATYTGTVSGDTAGSTLTLSNNDGGLFSLSGHTITGSGLTAGSASIAVTETLAGSTNTPKVTPFTLTVSASGVSYDASRGAYLNSDTSIGVYGDLSAAGSNTQQFTASFWINCNQGLGSYPANAGDAVYNTSCINDGQLLGQEVEPGTNTPAGCEANATGSGNTTRQQQGACVSWDNSSSANRAQFNLLNQYGYYSTDSIDLVGDGTLAHTVFQGVWRHVLVSLDTDANKVCNGGTGASPGGTYTANCWDVVVDGQSVKAYWSAPKFNPITPAIFNTMGMHWFDSWPTYIEGKWASSLSFDNTSLLNSSTGLIPSATIAKFNSYPTNSLNLPVRASGVTDCSDQYGHQPLDCHYGDGTALGAEHGTMGVAASKPLVAVAMSDQVGTGWSSGGVRTALPLTVGLMPAAFGPTGAPTGQPTMRWPTQGMNYGGGGSTLTSGAMDVNTQGLPISAGEGIVITGSQTDNSYTAVSNMQCPAPAGWSFTQITPTSDKAYQNSGENVIVCYARVPSGYTTGPMDFGNITWTVDASDLSHLNAHWTVSDYTNTSGFGVTCNWTATTNTATIQTCTDNTHLTTGSGSTLLTILANYGWQYSRGGGIASYPGEARYFERYGSQSGTLDRIVLTDTYGVALGTSINKSFVYNSTTNLFGGYGFALEIKP